MNRSDLVYQNGELVGIACAPCNDGIHREASRTGAIRIVLPDEIELPAVPFYTVAADVRRLLLSCSFRRDADSQGNGTLVWLSIH